QGLRSPVRATSNVVRLRRLVDGVTRFFDDRPHHRSQVSGLAKDLELPLRAGAVRQNLPDVLHLPPAAQIVQHIVDELEQLEAKLAHRNLAVLAEVDQLAVDAPARGAPLVLFDERAVISAEAQVTEAQAIELDDDGLRHG